MLVQFCWKTREHKFVRYNLLDSKSLEQLVNREHKLIQIQILDSIGIIRQCLRCCKLEYKKKEAVGLEIRNILGLTN